MVTTGGPCVGDTTHRHVGLRAVRIGGDPDVARPLTDRKVRPVFAIGPLKRVVSLNCVEFFRPVLHEAALLLFLLELCFGHWIYSGVCRCRTFAC
jgi:hypothetical protein